MQITTTAASHYNSGYSSTQPKIEWSRVRMCIQHMKHISHVVGFVDSVVDSVVGFVDSEGPTTRSYQGP